jgi:hypothetical protein
MRRILATAAVVTFALTGLSACGSDDGGDDSAAGCKGNDDPTKVIKVRVADDKVTPSGDRVEVKKCQTVEFIVAADDEGEIHIHSDPEQELAYEKGEHSFKVAFDKPGLVTVESHTLDQVIVQLEVS